MGRFSSHFILKLFCLLLPINPSLSYSLKNCTVQYQENLSAEVSLDCESRGLVTVPDDLPRDAVSVDLGGNQIEKLNKDDFFHMLKLRTLVLNSNLISHVDDGSFINLVLLKTLDMKINSLTNLTSNIFQGLSNLILLDLSVNKIKFIHSSAFQFLTSLETLQLDTNHLHEIADIQPILQLPKIKRLSVACNYFSSFETKDLDSIFSSSLKELSVSGYGLKKFSITTPIFPYLQKLHLSTSVPNKLTMEWDIPDKILLRNITQVSLDGVKFCFEEIQKVLQSLNSLRYLQLNYIDKWIKKHLLSTVCKIKELRRLNLFDAQLNNFTFKLAPCSQLLELDVSWCSILDLPKGSIQSMSKLRSLNVSHNQLTKVPYDVRSLTFLEILKMENNRISELTCEDFINMTHLTVLLLNNNKIKNVDRCVFKNLVDLRQLDLSNNMLPRFGDMFMISLQQLEVLDMIHNSIKTFTPDGIEGLKSMKQLNVEFILGKANIKTLHGLKNLKSVNSSKTLESQFILNVLQNLKSLTIYFKFSGSSEIFHSNNYENFFSFKSLKHLTLIWNMNIFFEPYEKESKILDDMNHLESFTAEKMFSNTIDVDIFQFNPELKSLILTKTVLTYLEPKLFLPIPNLEILDLSESKLKSLDFLRQANLTALRYLKVTDSEIPVINEAVLNSLPSLKYLDLDNNPFNCECSNADFIQWIKNNKQTQVVNAHQYECFLPVDRQGTLLLDFDVQSCWNDGSFFYFISSTCLVVLTL
ncbi:toll-like receptor 13, partial [Kryptolebias marmoratus]|uniref:toll-like receptor 13 n=1 Tax=Kryptolebias marmoratus TaxID=37003 RepID=UPI0007F90D2D